MFEKLHIENYKSIKELDLDCKRINLFIGEPNVGKSNILEAISLLEDGIGEHIRKENLRNLFFDQDDSTIVNVNTIVKKSLEQKKICLYFNKQKEVFIYQNDYKPLIISSSKKTFDDILEEEETSGRKMYDNKGTILEKKDKREYYKKGRPNVKSYLFRRNMDYNMPSEDLISLDYPYGKNLFQILRYNKDLLKLISTMFKKYGYGLVIDLGNNKMEIQKIVDNISYKIPYSLVADTLQRVIFHKAAIYSNKNNVLLFEEPENNSFPPYIRELAFDIIDSESNQFFIATHSPYLFNTIVSEAPEKEVAVHIVSFDNFQTKVNTLSNEQIAEISNYGIDVFFNLKNFTA